MSTHNSKPQVTLDDLATMIQQGFSEAAQKRNEMEARIKDEVKADLRKEIKLEGQEVRDYTDKVVGKYSAELTHGLRTVDDKVNTLTETLEDKDILSTEESSSIKNISPFPTTQPA